MLALNWSSQPALLDTDIGSYAGITKSWTLPMAPWAFRATFRGLPANFEVALIASNKRPSQIHDDYVVIFAVRRNTPPMSTFPNARFLVLPRGGSDELCIQGTAIEATAASTDCNSIQWWGLYTNAADEWEALVHCWPFDPAKSMLQKARRGIRETFA